MTIYLVFTKVVYKSFIERHFTKLSVLTAFLKAAMPKGFVYSLKYKNVCMITSLIKLEFFEVKCINVGRIWTSVNTLYNVKT